MSPREEFAEQIRAEARRALAEGCHTLRLPVMTGELEIDEEGLPRPAFGVLNCSAFRLVNDPREPDRVFDELVRISAEVRV